MGNLVGNDGPELIVPRSSGYVNIVVSRPAQGAYSVPTSRRELAAKLRVDGGLLPPLGVGKNAHRCTLRSVIKEWWARYRPTT